jgi:hypothetical protein
MARRSQAGIIRYTFGLEERGPRALFNLRMALVATALLAVTGALVVAVGERSPLSFKVARNATLMPQAVGSGQALNFFTLHLANRETNSQQLLIKVKDGGPTMELRGPAQPIIINGSEKRRIDIGLLTDLASLPCSISLELQATDGSLLASEQLQLLSPPAEPGPAR